MQVVKKKNAGDKSSWRNETETRFQHPIEKLHPLHHGFSGNCFIGSIKVEFVYFYLR